MGGFNSSQWNEALFGGALTSGAGSDTQFLVSDIFYMAYRLVGILGMPGRGYSPSEQSDAMFALQSMVDEWGISQYIACFAEQRTVFTLTSLKGVYSIGTDETDGAPDISIQRPVRIRAGGLIFTNTTPNVEPGLRVLSAQEWATLSPKELQSSVPSMLYYKPTVPNGELYVWPIPITEYKIALYAWIGLQQFAAPTDIVIVPPGYRSALQYNLAVRLADLNPTRAKLTARVQNMANSTLAKIKSVNAVPVLMQSELGALGATQDRGRYDILSNSWRK